MGEMLRSIKIFLKAITHSVVAIRKFSWKTMGRDDLWDD